MFTRSGITAALLFTLIAPAAVSAQTSTFRSGPVFFANGGGQAIVVRLFRQGADEGRATVAVGGNLNLIAANPGAWGNAIRATVSIAPNTPADNAAIGAIATPLGLTVADFFDLTLRDSVRETTEVFRNVSVAATAGARPC